MKHAVREAIKKHLQRKARQLAHKQKAALEEAKQNDKAKEATQVMELDEEPKGTLEEVQLEGKAEETVKQAQQQENKLEEVFVHEKVEENNDVHDEEAKQQKTVEGAFNAGDKVRVAFEDLLHKLKYGMNGNVQKVSGDEVTVMFEKLLAPVSVPRNVLVKSDQFKKSKPLTGLVRLSHTTKINLLRHSGLANPLEEKVTRWNGNQLMHDQGIDIFSTIAEYNLNIFEQHEKVFVVNTRLMRFLLEDFSGKALMQDYHKASAVLQEKRKQYVRKYYKMSKMTLIPIFGNKPDHWTLLVLEGNKISYFDSLNNIHQECKKNAENMLKILEVKDESNLTRINISRQSGHDCGLYVMHYVEDNLRHAAGEGRGTLPWPDQRMSQIKTWTKSWLSTLEGVRKKWADEELKLQKENDERQIVVLKAAEASLKKKGMLDELAAAHKNLAELLLTAGQNVEAVPLPEGFGQKPVKQKELEDKAVEAKGKAKDSLCDAEAKLEELPKQTVEEKATQEEVEDKLVEAKGQAKLEELEDKVVEAKEEAKLEQLEDKVAKAKEQVKHEELEDKVAEAKEQAKLDELEKAGEAKPDEEKANKAKAALKGKTIRQLTEAELLTVQMCVDNWTIEELRPEFREKYVRVRDSGVGVCGSCRYTTGCLRCDDKKAWNYWVRQELGLSNTVAKKSS